jgi:hypothetical protein
MYQIKWKEYLSMHLGGSASRQTTRKTLKAANSLALFMSTQQMVPGTVEVYRKGKRVSSFQQGKPSPKI